MSDVGRIKKRGESPFPSVRKSADPLQPEQGEVEFTQDLDEYLEATNKSVKETEKAEQLLIQDNDNKKEGPKKEGKKKRKKRPNPSEEPEKEDDGLELHLIDIEA